MMKHILKFKLDSQADFAQSIRTPVNSFPSHVGVIGGELCIWMECPFEHDMRSEMRDLNRRSHWIWYLRVFGTGQRIDARGVYRGTAIVGSNAYHVYEERVEAVTVEINERDQNERDQEEITPQAQSSVSRNES